MSTVTLTVRGIPKPQPRPKACKRGKGVHIYTPAGANAWKAAVRAAWITMRPHVDSAKVDYVGMVFFIPRPKSHHKNNDPDRGLTEAAPRHPNFKRVGDIDNLIKSTLDALVDAKVIDDDAQITQIQASKVYCSDGIQPGAQITLDEKSLVIPLGERG
jgi:Holliday junction resolvase RusA-like endonuclease